MLPCHGVLNIGFKNPPADNKMGLLNFKDLIFKDSMCLKGVKSETGLRITGGLTKFFPSGM